MNKLLLFVSLLLVSSVLVAQNHLDHPYKTYKAPDGKFYIQKSLPIYLFMSTNPDPSKGLHKLESDSTKQFSNPMYLDTEGYNTFRSPSAVDTVTKQIHYPMMDVVFEIYADSRSPKTKVEYDKKHRYISGNKLMIGANTTLTFTSSDAHAGTERILISIDSAGFKNYTAPITLDKEKSYDINYYSVDNVGNKEEIHHQVFHVDLSKPTTELVVVGDRFEQVVSGRTKIKLVPTDNLAGIRTTYYTIDGGKEYVYGRELRMANLREGEHTITYYSIDKVGNKEETKTFTFYIDKTAPILVDEIMGNSYLVNGKEYSSGRTKLKLTAVDNKAGVDEIKYSINNEEYISYEKPFYLSSVSGSLAVRSYAVDKVGNKSVANEKSTKNKATYVDLTGPQLKFNFTGKSFKTRDTIFINKDTQVKLQAFDAESGVKGVYYSLNSGPEKEYDKPFSIEKEGLHVLNINSYDHVDNSNRITANLVIDNKGPDVFSRFSILPVSQKEMNGQTVDVYSSQVVLFLSATDAKVAIDRIYYAINDGPEKQFTGIIDGFKRGREYKIKVKAFDKLGNVNEDVVMFATDNTGPQVFARFSMNPIEKVEVEGKSIDVYPPHVSLFLSVTNATVAYDKIFYSINGGKETLYKGIIDGFKQGDNIKMNIRALDRLGNQTNKEILFKIES